MALVIFVGCGQSYSDLKKLNVKSIVKTPEVKRDAICLFGCVLRSLFTFKFPRDLVILNVGCVDLSLVKKLFLNLWS
jgi:hypothetical protein